MELKEHFDKKVRRRQGRKGMEDLDNGRRSSIAPSQFHHATLYHGIQTLRNKMA